MCSNIRLGRSWGWQCMLGTSAAVYQGATELLHVHYGFVGFLGWWLSGPYTANQNLGRSSLALRVLGPCWTPWLRQAEKRMCTEQRNVEWCA